MKEISAALVKAQKEFGPALKTHTNPAFRSKYAGLDACIEAVLDALNNNGIFLMQPTHECEGGVIVETLFIHESGEQMSSGKLHVPATKLDAQGYGSALTYARRYSLMTACGITPEDDDGNAASKPASKASTPAPNAAAKPAARPVAAAPEAMQGKSDGTPSDGAWFIKVETKPGTDVKMWVSLVITTTHVALEQAQNETDVMSIFKVNRNIYDHLKVVAAEDYESLMSNFKSARTKFKEK